MCGGPGDPRLAACMPAAAWWKACRVDRLAALLPLCSRKLAQLRAQSAAIAAGLQKMNSAKEDVGKMKVRRELLGACGLHLVSTDAGPRAASLVLGGQLA